LYLNELRQGGMYFNFSDEIRLAENNFNIKGKYILRIILKLS